MVAPLGNKFWELRPKHGRGLIYPTPDALWERACEYFEWCQDNPLYEYKAFNCGEMGIVQEPIPKMRAMTIQALCFFLGLSDEAWSNYCKREDFIGICNDIKQVIYSQKFEGASAGLLNASIIAREIGLASSSDSAISAKDEIELEIKRLELEKLKRDVNPTPERTPDEDYKIELKPDEEVPSEPIL